MVTTRVGYGDGDLAARAPTGGATFHQGVRLRDVGQRQHGADHRPKFALVDQPAEGLELRPAGADEDYGTDADGGRVHDLLGSRCDPYINRILTGEDADVHCHSNLTRAVLPYGLTELDVHDVLNIFTVTGINPDGEYFMKPSPAKPGDFFEFFAEQDLLCALSTCPAGDLSVPMWGTDARDPIEVCRPLDVEILRPDPALVDGWTPPPTAQYAGLHGLDFPERRTDTRHRR